MAIPDNLWQVAISAGWYSASTSPPADQPRSRFVSKYHLQSTHSGASTALASQLANKIRSNYTFTVLKRWWAEWVWFERVEVVHLESEIEGSNANAQRLGMAHLANVKDLPLNAAAFAFARAKDLGHQTRQWFGGLNSSVLDDDGQVDWVGNNDFRTWCAEQLTGFVIGIRTYTRVVYTPATETVHQIEQRLKVGEFRSIRRRSLTGSESYSPL